MKLVEVERLRGELAEFVGDVFGLVSRRDQRRWGECYMRGLMLDGRRKSIQPMAERLPDGNMQALQQFVSQSTWDETPVRRRIAQRLTEAVAPQVWVVDDVSFPKCGTASPGVARQYCGALGKRANCQVAVSVHGATDTASCPLQWRLYLPREWAEDWLCSRRRAAFQQQFGRHLLRWMFARTGSTSVATGGAPSVARWDTRGKALATGAGLVRQSAVAECRRVPPVLVNIDSTGWRVPPETIDICRRNS
jgi:hypothetical protein